MEKHILLEKAYAYPEPTISPVPSGYTYEELRGYWMDPLTGKAMLLDSFAQHLATKKEDRETGEDQKGE